MSRPILFVALLALTQTSCGLIDADAASVAARGGDGSQPRSEAPTQALGPVVSEPALWDGMARRELAVVDARGSAKAAELDLQELSAFSEGDRKVAAKALHGLQVDCPYNRSVVQVPIALLAVVQGIETEALMPLIQSDWAFMRQSMESRVAANELLGADLPLPNRGDFLHGRLPEGALVTKAQLLQSEDPVGQTLLLVNAIGEVVSQYDKTTTDRISANDRELQWITQEQWPQKATLRGWHETLQRIQPHVHHPGRQAQVTAMIDLLERTLNQGC